MNMTLKGIIISAGLCIVVIFSVSAQRLNCTKFKNGKFKTTLAGFGIVMIYRTGNIQREVTDKGIEMLFEVNWLNDCSYTLKPSAQDIKKYKVPANTLITVTISRTTDTSYFQTTTTNILNRKFSTEIIKLN